MEKVAKWDIIYGIQRPGRLFAAIRNHSVFFNEEKMHKKPVKTVEVRRVIFQEDGHENVGAQQQVAQRQEEARVREDEQVVEAHPVVR